jgi:SAM-dependent methyltransferase
LAVAARAFLAFRRHHPRRFVIKARDLRLFLRDATIQTGYDRHYVLHIAWAARVLQELRPTSHVDVASSMYFVATVSAFVPVTALDIRPAAIELSGLEYRRGSLHALPFKSGSIESVSCMHVLEHVGLGRYGDPLDYDGDLKALAELARVVAPGGHLLIAVPMSGEPRIEFNAHRVYSFRQFVAMSQAVGLELREFALIPDDGSEETLIRHASEAIADRQRYGCGCFLLGRGSGP